MSADIATTELRADGTGSTIPMMTLQELDADSHGTFRRYRKHHPIVLHESGSYFVLRPADIERLSKDARLVGSGTAVPEMTGFDHGVMFDVFRYSMLTADGDVHRRRGAPFSRLFAARASPRCARASGARSRTSSMAGTAKARSISWRPSRDPFPPASLPTCSGCQRRISHLHPRRL